MDKGVIAMTAPVVPEVLPTAFAEKFGTNGPVRLKTTVRGAETESVQDPVKINSALSRLSPAGAVTAGHVTLWVDGSGNVTAESTAHVVVMNPAYADVVRARSKRM